ncbi:MAG: TetR family transcriptional regulator [Rhodobacteraceae bacterium]|nr:TetR family transcriptional regulator [Paracoccaceae bacterium]
MTESRQKPRGSQQLWLEAALDTLTRRGVEAVKIMPLAQKLGLTRTGFYGHFTSREALLEAMIKHWEQKNTGNLEASCSAYAESICEAIFNLFDCWIDPKLFDARLDLAIRNWARNAPALQARLDAADARRTAAIAAMFRRAGYSEPEANTRAMTILYTQIGYISMQIKELLPARIARMPAYVEVYTAQKPTAQEIMRFNARHGL